MAENDKSTRTRTGLAIGAGVMGAVTASVGIVTPAQAVDYPSWNDVQQAKSSVANQQAMIENITSLIGTLQSGVDAARVESAQAAEAYLDAKIALDTATAKETDLQKQATDAASKAKTSQMRAGLLASHLAKSTGGGMTSQLMLNGGGSGDDADQLLFQLGTMSKLTEQSKAVYDQATKDKNAAESLKAQATSAKSARQDLATQADTALASATAAQARAQSALATQESKSTELIAQLATLKNTSSTVEAAYLQGEQAKAQQEAARRAAEQAGNSGGGSSSGGGSGGGGGGSSSGGGGSSSGGGGGGTVAPPNGNVVETAISYARSQLGKPYQLGGAGPNTWDCSGLTMKSYAYAGTYIGSHSVNNQYYTAQSKGQLVSYGAKEPGDLIFWGSGPGSFYHIGIYIGGGQMIAAPTEGDVVKIQSVWGSPWYQVARPSA